MYSYVRKDAQSLKIPKRIRIRKSKKDRQHNDEEKKEKQRSTKHTHKTKERVTRLSEYFVF
jgi:hypothetical protein